MSTIRLNIWKELADEKFPKFILQILKQCAFDSNSLLVLDEKSIKEIEQHVRDNPELIKKTIYEKENILENISEFKF